VREGTLTSFGGSARPSRSLSGASIEATSRGIGRPTGRGVGAPTTAMASCARGQVAASAGPLELRPAGHAYLILTRAAREANHS
jgi:hypothetical protein